MSCAACTVVKHKHVTTDRHGEADAMIRVIHCSLHYAKYSGLPYFLTVHISLMQMEHVYLERLSCWLFHQLFICASETTQ